MLIYIPPRTMGRWGPGKVDKALLVVHHAFLPLGIVINLMLPEPFCTFSPLQIDEVVQTGLQFPDLPASASQVLDF